MTHLFHQGSAVPTYSNQVTFIEIKRAAAAFRDIVKHEPFHFALQPSLVEQRLLKEGERVRASQ